MKVTNDFKTTTIYELNESELSAITGNGKAQT